MTSAPNQPQIVSPKSADPRLRAWQALIEMETTGTGTQAALRQVLDESPALQGPDRGLTSQIVYGVQRKRRPLDHWLEASCQKGIYRMEWRVLCALRVGAYQLAYMQVPVFAAVHATIEACKPVLNHGQIGFVHAVLRALARRVDCADWPQQDDLPPWIAHRLTQFSQQVHGDPTQMRQAFGQHAPLHVRIFAQDEAQVLQTLAEDGVAVLPTTIPHVFQSDGSALYRSRAFAARQVLPQDAASAAVVAWLDAQPGEQVLDLAAGRGVKSLGLASSGAAVTAVDLHPDKLIAAQNLCDQAGFPLLAALVADTTQPIALPHAHFDRVLLDAPCSGLGTLRRRPEIRHRRQAVDLVRMAQLQMAMLRQAAPLVKQGGVLIFATCSFAIEEGPLVIADFLRDHAEFKRSDFQPSWIGPLLDDHGDLRSHPLQDLGPMITGADAFYAARLQRQ